MRMVANSRCKSKFPDTVLALRNSFFNLALALQWRSSTRWIMWLGKRIFLPNDHITLSVISVRARTWWLSLQLRLDLNYWRRGLSLFWWLLLQKVLRHNFPSVLTWLPSKFPGEARSCGGDVVGVVSDWWGGVDLGLVFHWSCRLWFGTSDVTASYKPVFVNLLLNTRLWQDSRLLFLILTTWGTWSRITCCLLLLQIGITVDTLMISLRVIYNWALRILNSFLAVGDREFGICLWKPILGLLNRS